MEGQGGRPPYLYSCRGLSTGRQAGTTPPAIFRRTNRRGDLPVDQLASYSFTYVCMCVCVCGYVCVCMRMYVCMYVADRLS